MPQWETEIQPTVLQWFLQERGVGEDVRNGTVSLELGSDLL